MCPSVISFIDTIELFFRRPPRGLRTKLQLLIRKRVLIRNVNDENNVFRGVRVVLQQPDKKLLRNLTKLDWKFKLHRLDIAYDFIAASITDAGSVTERLKSSIVLKYARSLPFQYQTVTYWAKPSASRNLVLYSDRPSRKSGLPCAHLELRLIRTATLRRFGLNELEDVLTLDPVEILNRCALLVELDDGHERRIKNHVRRTHRNFQRKGVSAFSDRYNASVAHRTSALLKRIGFDTVQGAYRMVGDAKVRRRWRRSAVINAVTTHPSVNFPNHSNGG
jgi:hypothetical protein